MNGGYFQSHLPGTLVSLLRAVRSPRCSFPTAVWGQIPSVASNRALNPQSAGVNVVPWCYSHLTELTRAHVWPRLKLLQIPSASARLVVLPP